MPRLSSLVLSGPAGLWATTEVIASADEDRRCVERAELSFPTDAARRASSWVRTSSSHKMQPLPTLAPGATVCVRLRLEHQHVLHGDYDPLLGTRTLNLTLGAATLQDTLPLDREQYRALPRTVPLVPDRDHRDTRVFLSAPDSLYLAAHLPGYQTYRFPEQPVRHGTRMRLEFWYLIATDTRSAGHAHIVQYKDSPSTWQRLADGQIDLPLTTIGHWTKVERDFDAAAEATTVALDVGIDPAPFGELWVDDVSLSPLGAAPEPMP